MTKRSRPLEERTVGVIERDDAKMQPGYTLFNAGRETYLIDEDGREVHQWTSSRKVFTSYLLPNGNLIRDGNDNIEAVCFKAGGAAGFIEEVTWDNEVVWNYAALPYGTFLTHHEVEPMPNGNVLVLVWQRKSKEEAVAAGRRPELLPDGEVWDNLIFELKPDGKGSADIVWQWSMWDHLIQDFDKTKKNFGEVRAHPELVDINFCPPGGKFGCRNRANLTGDGSQDNPSGFEYLSKMKGKTGEKDWLHINAVSYDEKRDQILMSVNVFSEVMLIDHATTTEVAAGHTGGKRGRGGDILHRFGNPQAYRQGCRMEQTLFCQHGAQFIRGAPGDGNILLFNNGRFPDRHWSSVDEYKIPDVDGVFPECAPREKHTLVWTYGPRVGRKNSVYSTHISGCKRLKNGNTFMILGPQGIIIELTKEGEEVWRYVNPVMVEDEYVGRVRQGDDRVKGKFSLFGAERYPAEYPAFSKVKPLTPGPYLEM